jgi:hypothetical protein
VSSFPLKACRCFRDHHSLDELNVDRRRVLIPDETQYLQVRHTVRETDSSPNHIATHVHFSSNARIASVAHSKVTSTRHNAFNDEERFVRPVSAQKT